MCGGCAVVVLGLCGGCGCAVLCGGCAMDVRWMCGGCAVDVLCGSQLHAQVGATELRSRIIKIVVGNRLRFKYLIVI